ncbi:cysteine-rich repeat secretory protein 55 isoform X2 [Cryptomeria japonica]|uniref:cysteine-rich repeat secretory protein 55 isoform X2 n=1 Tax=Cryptomeria japonica TaxID=3369 RepID=UPI0027DA66BA|nr:cysteine-rich repeat secretory protein 55 isoform X2 [Cryptomeria japonica]
MRCNSLFRDLWRRRTFLPWLLLMIFPTAICDYRWSTCNNASTYTDGSTYSSNLKKVIKDLVRNTPQSSGFNTTTHGQSANKVYGLLQCIGNKSTEKCSNCLRDANNALQELCGNEIGGQVWMDYCYLHYDNSNFLSKLDTTMHLLENVKNIANNMEGFKSTTSNLLRNLSDKAYDPANKGFAVGSAKYSTSERVYGLVQCWRDLSIMDCRSCLFRAREALKQCCSPKQGAHAMSGSCTVRYEIYPFFDLRDPSSTSTPSTAPLVHTSEKSSKTLPIIMGLVGVTVFALFICLIAMRKRLKSTLLGSPVTLERHRFSPESELLIQGQNFIFSLGAPAEATANFDDNKKIGEDDFGGVYKGTTRDGKEIADICDEEAIAPSVMKPPLVY